MPRQKPSATAPDWDRAGSEAVALLVDLLRADTTNPPGRELRAARVLEAYLSRAGVRSEIHEIAKDRVNLYARVGSTRKRPGLAFASHLDVVPADAADWRVPPFEGKIVDDEIWGRGTVDMKGTMAMQAAAVAEIARAGVALDGDLVVIAVADEEQDSLGAQALLRDRKDVFEHVGYLQNEGETIHTERGSTLYYGVAVTEKAPLWMTLTAHGEASHGSIPMPDSALLRLNRALVKLTALEWPILVTPAVKIFLESRAAREPGLFPKGVRTLERAVASRAGRERLLGDPDIAALLRNTLSVTTFHAGDKSNTIPAHAKATIDVRLLPGVKPADVLARLRKTVAADSVEITVDVSEGTLASQETGPFFDALARVRDRHDPNVPILPVLLTASTDASVFRRAGVQSYGFEPFRQDDDEPSRAHGKDERLSVADVRRGTRILGELALELCGAR